nr:MAG TPA: DNA binding protein [Caudoviricetes sp.]
MLFNNLSAELARNKLTLKALSELTGIKYESLKNKMSGATEFKRSEMVAIKEQFPTCSLDYLFKTEM